MSTQCLAALLWKSTNSFAGAESAPLSPTFRTSTSNLSRSRSKRPSDRTFTFEKASGNDTDKTSNKIEGKKEERKKNNTVTQEWVKKTEKLESLLFLLWYQYLNDQCNTQELNCFMNKGTIWESLSSRTLLERNDTYSQELFCVFNTCFPLYAFNQNRCNSRCSNVTVDSNENNLDVTWHCKDIFCWF